MLKIGRGVSVNVHRTIDLVMTDRLYMYILSKITSVSELMCWKDDGDLHGF